MMRRGTVLVFHPGYCVVNWRRSWTVLLNPSGPMTEFTLGSSGKIWYFKRRRRAKTRFSSKPHSPWSSIIVIALFHSKILITSFPLDFSIYTGFSRQQLRKLFRKKNRDWKTFMNNIILQVALSPFENRQKSFLLSDLGLFCTNRTSLSYLQSMWYSDWSFVYLFIMRLSYLNAF